MLETKVTGVDYRSVFNFHPSFYQKWSENSLLPYRRQIIHDSAAVMKSGSTNMFEDLQSRLTEHLLQYRTPYDGKAGANHIGNEMLDAIGYIDFLAKNFHSDPKLVEKLKVALYEIFIGKVSAPWTYIPKGEMPLFKAAELLLAEKLEGKRLGVVEPVMA